eukprot:scaffold21420_cov129-Isochrysis_galbana.AAC.5
MHNGAHRQTPPQHDIGQQHTSTCNLHKRMRKAMNRVVSRHSPHTMLPRAHNERAGLGWWLGRARLDRPASHSG